MTAFTQFRFGNQAIAAACRSATKRNRAARDDDFNRMLDITISEGNRYLLPCIGLASIGAGHSAAELLRRNLMTRVGALIALLASVGIAVGLMVGFHASSIRCGLGLEAREEFLNHFRLYRVCAAINRQTPENSKILLFGEERGFYLDRDYMWGSPGHHSLLPYKELRTANDWLRAMKELGMTHCLVNFDNVKGDASKWIADGYKQGLFAPIVEDGEIVVFELREMRRPVRP